MRTPIIIAILAMTACCAPADLPAALRTEPRDRGTSVVPDGVAPPEICERFNARPPAPSAGRLEHFRWITEHDCHIDGWYGQMLAATPDGDRYLVEVRLSPYLSSKKRGIPFTTAAYIETYELKDGTFRFLHGRASNDRISIFGTD